MTVSNGSEHEIASYQGNTYTYINDERLKTVSSGSNNYSLAYDALGRCVKRTLNGVTIYYVYDGEKPILESNSSGAIAGRNLYGKAIDEILLRVDVASNWTLYYQQDHEGSVTHLTNATGSVIATYRYDAFGAPTFYDYTGTQVSTSPFNNRFLFTGREYAATFSFYEYRARAYNPTLGRFMSEDPKLFDAGDYNLYRYCHNDPEDMTDPMGLDFLPPVGTPDAIARWNQVYATWSASPMMKPILQFIKNSGVDIPVILNRGNKNQGGNVLYLDPYHGGELKEGGINSPGVIGSHEVSHVASYIKDPQRFQRDESKTDKRSIALHKATMSNAEEDRAMKTEQTYARERGEPVRPRYEQYKSQPETQGVNSNVPAQRGKNEQDKGQPPLLPRP